MFVPLGQGQGPGGAEKRLRGQTSWYQNGGGAKHDGGACGGDAALHDGVVERGGVGYAGASVVHEHGGVENVGENETGLRAPGVVGEADQGVAAAGEGASASTNVGANDGGWVLGQPVGPETDLSPCRVHSSPCVPCLLCAVRLQGPNPCLQRAWSPKEDTQVPCSGQTPFHDLALASLSRVALPVPDHVG